MIEFPLFAFKIKLSTMNEIKKILFPTDFSETAQNAFRYALLLADKFEASIEVLNVVYPQYETIELPVLAASATRAKVDASDEMVKTFIEHGLAQVGKSLAHVPIITAEIAVGEPTVLINAIANRKEIDLIVMGTKEHHNLFENLFGSTSTEVLANSSCHTLIIPENSPYHEPKTIMYATDLSEADPYHIWNVMRLFSIYAPIYHINHVETGQNTKMKMSDMEGFFAQNAPTLDITFHDSSANTAIEGIEIFLNTHQIDLLVMHAPHRNLFERLFHKSVTRHFSLHTKTPLLIYKESGI